MGSSRYGFAMILLLLAPWGIDSRSCHSDSASMDANVSGVGDVASFIQRSRRLMQEVAGAMSGLRGRSIEVQVFPGGGLALRERSSNNNNHNHNNNNNLRERSLGSSTPTKDLEGGEGEQFSFQEWAKTVDWNSLSHDPTARIPEFEREIMPWLIMEPLLQGKVNEEPPALMAVPQGCNDHGQVFHGMRKMPAAMIDMFKLGYDADVVEVRLREYADIVDLVVIVEAESSHWGVPKLSMWDRLRAQSRFTPFSDKLLHLVFTWADIHGNGTSKVVRKREQVWTTERVQNNLIRDRMPEVLRHLKVHSDSIVLNFGDADEVTSRNNMHLMKHCEPKKLPVDSGIWFPMGRVDRAFRTDWPTGGFQYTLGDPTFQSPSHFVGLGHGKSGPYLLGGMHMTDYNYLPFRVMKVLSASEAGGVPQAWSNLLTLGNVSKLFFAFSNMEAPVFPASWRARIIPLGELFKKSLAYKDMVYVPWFLAANEARFPAWFGKEDPRVFSKVRRST